MFETNSTIVQCGFDFSNIPDWVGAVLVVSAFAGRVVWVLIKKMIETAEERDKTGRETLLKEVKIVIEGFCKYSDMRMDQLEKSLELTGKDTQKLFDLVGDARSKAENTATQFADLKAEHNKIKERCHRE